MATWTQSNPVSIGDATKKQHYDKVFDNSLALMSSMLVDHLTPSGGAFGGQHPFFRHATLNQGDTPAPTRYGKVEVVFDATVTAPVMTTGTSYNNTLIDNSMNYKDKYIIVNGIAAMCASSDVADAWRPGGSNDNQIWGGVYGAAGVTVFQSEVNAGGEGTGENIFRGFGYTRVGHDLNILPSSGGNPAFRLLHHSHIGELYVDLMVANSDGFLYAQFSRVGDAESAHDTLVAVVHGSVSVFSDEGHQ